MNLIQRGKANVKVRVRCLVLVKIYGNSPKKLLNKINENKEIKIKALPGFLFGPKRVLNSLNNKNRLLFHKKLLREGINQKEQGIRFKPINVLSQFKERLKIEVEGSNTENRFVIIFNLKDLFYCFLWWLYFLKKRFLVLENKNNLLH